MTLNRAKKDNIEQRREIVAQLRLRMLSMREICAALEKQGIVSPITGRAYDVTTIKADIDALKQTWHANANVATEEHQSRQHAEIQEIKRLAWSQKDGKLALSALDKEMKLLGTMRQPDGLTINITLVTQLVQAIERRGDSASAIFEEMLRELENAERTITVP